MANTLGQFIVEEMHKRHLSGRQMAVKVGVSSSTLNGYINDENADPSLGFLRKLAKYTGTPLPVLLALAYPDVAGELGVIDPDMLLLARELSDLPQVLQDAIKRMIRGE
jgi:transcriptional regulator with XRE-family HTH domain